MAMRLAVFQPQLHWPFSLTRCFTRTGADAALIAQLELKPVFPIFLDRRRQTGRVHI